MYPQIRIDRALFREPDRANRWQIPRRREGKSFHTAWSFRIRVCWAAFGRGSEESWAFGAQRLDAASRTQL
jgi:hypothetical protein